MKSCKSPALLQRQPLLEQEHLHLRVSWLVSVLLSTMDIVFLNEYEWVKAKGHRPASSVAYFLSYLKTLSGLYRGRSAGWKDTSCPWTNVGQLTKRFRCSQYLPEVYCQDHSSARHSSNADIQMTPLICYIRILTVCRLFSYLK